MIFDHCDNIIIILYNNIIMTRSMMDTVSLSTKKRFFLNP